MHICWNYQSSSQVNYFILVSSAANWNFTKIFDPESREVEIIFVSASFSVALWQEAL